MNNRLKHKTFVFTNTTTPDIVRGDDKVIEQYDSLISKEIADCNAWRLIAIISMALVVTGFVFMIKAVNAPKEKLVVVSVNDIGETKYVGETDGVNFDNYKNKDPIVNNMITKFIKNTYKVSVDRQYMKDSFIEVMNMLTQDKKVMYNSYINENDPFILSGHIKREAAIETILPIGKSVYQADYIVTTTDTMGFDKKSVRYRALFSFYMMKSSEYNQLKLEQRELNPMGIYISDYSITEVKNEKK